MWVTIDGPLVYERVYLPLCKVADIPLHIQGDQMVAHHVSVPLLCHVWVSSNLKYTGDVSRLSIVYCYFSY